MKTVFVTIAILLLSPPALAKRYFAPTNPDGHVEMYFETTSGIFTLGEGKSAVQLLAPTLLKNDLCAQKYAAIIDAAVPQLKAALKAKFAKIQAVKKGDRISVTFALATHYDFPKNNINFDRCSLNITLAEKATDNWSDIAPLTFSNSKGTLTVDKGYCGAAQAAACLIQSTSNYLYRIVFKVGKIDSRTAGTATPLGSSR